MDAEVAATRLAQIRQLAARITAEDGASGPRGATAPKGGREGRRPSRRAVAKAAGVGRTTVQRMELHVALARQFPFLQREDNGCRNAPGQGAAVPHLSGDGGRPR